MTNETDLERPHPDNPPVERRDARLDDIKPPTKKEEPNVWLREGTDAPDAADIEDPETQL